MPELGECLLTCANCEQQIREAEADDAGWRFFSDGFELLPFCSPCIEREFAPDAPCSRDPMG